MKTALFALALAGLSFSLSSISVPEWVKAPFRAKPEVHVASHEIGHGFDPLTNDDDFWAIRNVYAPDGTRLSRADWKEAIRYGYNLIPVAE